MERERPAGLVSGWHRCEWQMVAITSRAEAARLRRKLQSLGIGGASGGSRLPGDSRRDPTDELAEALRNLLENRSSSRANARAALARYDEFFRR
jgi:hypothetical protein